MAIDLKGAWVEAQTTRFDVHGGVHDLGTPKYAAGLKAEITSNPAAEPGLKLPGFDQ